MMISMPYNVNLILDKLYNNGFEGYIVGGCVRDSLLSRTPNDWDICTNAKPDEMLEIFKDFIIIPTGLKHGTATIVIEDEQFEVTSYRIDGKYSDGRRPDEVVFTNDITKDLSRRDFTINSMAYNTQVGLIDPFGGQRDIKNKIICCVGKADKRFEEDGLRVLRGIRFATQLGFNFDFDTMMSISSHSYMLENISKERIREEFNKILLSDKPSTGINLLWQFGLLQYIIPELNDCFGFEQHNKNHYKDVYEHIMLVLNNIEPKLELRLSALLHDIGKPNTFTMDEYGEGHFFGHHKESSKICRKIMEDLKYSNREIEYVSELVYHHMTRYQKLRPSSVKKFIIKVGEDKLEDLFKLFIADRIGSRPPHDFEEIYRLKFECEKILNEKQPLSLKDLAIDGNDLIKCGFPQTEEIGLTLRYILELVLDNPELNEKNTLLPIANRRLNEYKGEGIDDRDKQ